MRTWELPRGVSSLQSQIELMHGGLEAVQFTAAHREPLRCVFKAAVAVVLHVRLLCKRDLQLCRTLGAVVCAGGAVWCVQALVGAGTLEELGHAACAFTIKI